MYSYAKMIPDDLIAELIVLRDVETASAWRIGDIVLEVMEYAKANVPGVGKMDVYSAVGSFAGKSARTVREYAAISHFYSLEIREVYDVLAYEHFRQAAMLGERWQEALDWCVNQTVELGRPATVDAMLAVFSGGEIVEDAIGSLDDVPTAVECAEDKSIGMLRRLVGSIRDILISGKVHLPEDREEQVRNALEVIESVLLLGVDK